MPAREKFEAFGWYVQEIDGHNFSELEEAISKAKIQEKPSMIIANTVKGKGISFMENQVSWHGKAPNQEEYQKAMEEIEILERKNEERENLMKELEEKFDALFQKDKGGEN